MTKLSISRAWEEARVALVAQRRLLVPLLLGLVLVPTTLIALVEPQVPKGATPAPGAWMLVTLFALLAMVTAQMAVVLLVNGWRGSLGEAIMRSLKRMPVLIVTGLVVGLLFLSLGLLILGLGATVHEGGGQILVSGMGMAGRISLLLLAILALFVSLRLLPLAAVIVEGDQGPFAAMKHCWALTRGHLLKLLGVLVLVAVALLIVASAVGAVIGSLAFLLFGPPKPLSLSMLLLGLANGAVQAAFIGVYTALLARIWAQLERPA